MKQKIVTIAYFEVCPCYYAEITQILYQFHIAHAYYINDFTLSCLAISLACNMLANLDCAYARVPL